ncbi:hypothetical protein [Telluribacter humicola]|uniref:hypothetical protein n=1 Tax=Telluribacter humicola TaxID=1720261 RepID=UPI001A977079|nr:hypothetical protein [Telluribacter humicola]
MILPFIYSTGQTSSRARFRLVRLDQNIKDLYYLQLQYRVRAWYGWRWKTVTHELYLETGFSLDAHLAKQSVIEKARDEAFNRISRRRFARIIGKEVGHEA